MLLVFVFLVLLHALLRRYFFRFATCWSRRWGRRLLPTYFITPWWRFSPLDGACFRPLNPHPPPRQHPRSLSMSMPVIPGPSALLLRIEFNQGIDPHDGDAGLHRALQLADLAHAGLENPGPDLIHHFSPRQIQPVVLVVSAFCYGALGGFSVFRGSRAGIRGLGRRFRWRRRWCRGGHGEFVADLLWRCVTWAQVCNEFWGVFRGVDSESAGNDE